MVQRGAGRAGDEATCSSTPSRTVRAKALKIRYRVNVNTLEQETAEQLADERHRLRGIRNRQPAVLRSVHANRITGSFILIDPISNATLGAGMIRADLADQTVETLRAGTCRQWPLRSATSATDTIPGLILVEDNPALATRLERALFDDHFEVLLLSGDTLSVPIWRASTLRSNPQASSSSIPATNFPPKRNANWVCWRRTASSIFPQCRCTATNRRTCARRFR